MRAKLVVVFLLFGGVGCGSEAALVEDLASTSAPDFSRPSDLALAPIDLARPVDDLAMDDLAMDELAAPDLASNEPDLSFAADDLSAPPDAISPTVDATIVPDLFDPCTTLACANGGTCVVGDEGVFCACAPGYSGPLCATNIDDCTPNPCPSGHLCTDGVDSYMCTCPVGFAGPSCACQTGDVTIKYYLEEIYEPVPSVDTVPPGVHVTGSAAIQLSSTGLGIVGGAYAAYIDNGESIDFAFDFPATSFVIGAGNFENVNNNGSWLEQTIEAFSPSGVSLGVKSAQDGNWNVTSKFGGQLLGRVRVTGAPDGLTIPKITVAFDCE